MATTTPNYGWDVPTSTDYVAQGAVAIETLGDDIDASLFSITGGKNVGLVHINTTTVTSAATTTISNIFTSAFNDYFITWNGRTSTSGGAQNLWLTLTSGGTPGTASTWADLLLFTNDASGPSRAFATSLCRLGYVGDNFASAIAYIFNPQATAKTMINAQSTQRSGVDMSVTVGGGIYNATTSFDGLQFTTGGGGSLTGTFRIYGLRTS